MIFSTSIFIFLFLPLFLLVYYLLPFRWRSFWILIASYAFYAWWRVDFLALFAATTLWSYLMGRGIGHFQDRAPKKARVFLTIGVIGNLGVLAYFKYFNFGVDSLNALLSSLGVNTFNTWQVILPIGISFYVFQATSYLIDIYRRDAPANEPFFDVAAYIALFPQLIAGPILRYKNLAEQFRSRRHTFDKFSEGSARFMLGFSKKVLIADGVATIVNSIFSLTAPTLAEAWLGTLAYAVQLYFDFSGYSDMAIGLGLMMGFRFTENFRHPYASQSITEFWQRWHISLSNWLRDYLYIPLGGNRKGARRTYINLMLVMLLGGLWHGAAWTFVLWGAWHGGWLVIERLTNRATSVKSVASSLTTPWTLLRTVVTFGVVALGWVTFRAVNLAGAWRMYRGLFGLQGLGISESLSWQLSTSALFMLAVGLVALVISPWWRQLSHKAGVQWRAGLMSPSLLLVPLFILSVLRISAESFSPFLYFQF
jgi:alginate O-acetyltransferase complex protein AlgI